MKNGAALIPSRPATSARPSQRLTSNTRWKVFFLLWVLVVINFIDRASLSIALPMISDEFQLSPEATGWILSSFFWTYALAQIPGGWLIDRVGPRKVVVWSATLWGGFQRSPGRRPGRCSCCSPGSDSVPPRPPCFPPARS
jgi:ACS family D-galactonate transporter-like MFS transporter